MDYIVVTYLKIHNLTRHFFVSGVNNYSQAVESCLYNLSQKDIDEIKDIYVIGVREMQPMPLPVDKPSQG